MPNGKLSGFAGWSEAELRKIRWIAGLAATYSTLLLETVDRTMLTSAACRETIYPIQFD